ncbi:hypothetical protein IWX83_002957 [Flavobacterium sp. CG_9.1]|nr:hypothetical protein [Flavobacterium sp. CG_9.1]
MLGTVKDLRYNYRKFYVFNSRITHIAICFLEKKDK